MKRKLGLGISVVAIVCAVFWMRALASWRPVTVAKLHFQPAQLHFSRDGRKLLVANDVRTFRAILNIETGEHDYDLRRIRALERSLETYPRLGFDERSERIIFYPSPRKSVRLRDLGIGRDMVGTQNGKSPRCGWSKSRREVYLGFMGEIYIWNWKGKLKRRVRYAKDDSNQFTFSPDGKWLITTDSDKTGKIFLRRYELQTGKMMEIINTALGFPDFGFSPDGRNFWFRRGNGGQFDDLQWIRTSDFKFPWGETCSGPVKWLADGRMGFVGPQGFRLVSGDYRDSRVLPGPFYDRLAPARAIKDWTLSPNGNYIYSAEQSGIIRRWRAR